MKKKILALCLVVVLAVTAVTGATLAYFTDTEDVTNTFTVGNIEIKLDEADNTKTDGSRTEEGNQYDDIYPGAILAKDPTVTVVKGSEDCYVRMKVEVKNYEQLTKAFPAEKYADYYADGIFLLQKLVDWETAWEYVSCVDGVYEFRYNAVVAENNEKDTVLPALFTTVTIPTALTNAELAELDGIQIVITADAMQAANGNGTFTAEEAWTAFEG